MNDMNPTPDNFLQLDNETKIKFCNAWHALARHYTVCKECQIYLLDGDGDLCSAGKTIIAIKMCFTDTSIEFPPNGRDERQPTGE